MSCDGKRHIFSISLILGVESPIAKLRGTGRFLEYLLVLSQSENELSFFGPSHFGAG